MLGQVPCCDADRTLYLFTALQREVPPSLITTFLRTADITARSVTDCAVRGRSRLGPKPSAHNWRISRMRQYVSIVVRTSKINAALSPPLLYLSTFTLENCVLLGYYTAYCGNSLPTFRDKLSVPSSSVKNPGCTAIPYRRFGATHQSRLQNQDRIDILRRNVGKELPLHAA